MKKIDLTNFEAFELVVANKIQNSLHHSVFFNEATALYDCADDASAAVQFFCCDLNSDWRIWKAAKADTDDQITVSYERLQELIEIGVKAALEAQEQSHE